MSYRVVLSRLYGCYLIVGILFLLDFILRSDFVLILLARQGIAKHKFCLLSSAGSLCTCSPFIMSGVNHIMAFAFVSSGKKPYACCGGSRGVRDKGTAIRSHLYYFFYMAGYCLVICSNCRYASIKSPTFSRSVCVEASHRILPRQLALFAVSD